MAFSNGSFPLSPQVGQRFYDPDRWLMWQFDGTRWVAKLEQDAILGPSSRRVAAAKAGLRALAERLSTRLDSPTAAAVVVPQRTAAVGPSGG